MGILQDQLTQVLPSLSLAMGAGIIPFLIRYGEDIVSKELRPILCGLFVLCAYLGYHLGQDLARDMLYPMWISYTSLTIAIGLLSACLYPYASRKLWVQRLRIAFIGIAIVFICGASSAFTALANRTILFIPESVDGEKVTKIVGVGDTDVLLDFVQDQEALRVQIEDKHLNGFSGVRILTEHDNLAGFYSTETIDTCSRFQASGRISDLTKLSR